MKLDFNCTICIDKSGKVFLYHSRLIDLNLPKWDLEHLHFKFIFSWFKREKIKLSLTFFQNFIVASFTSVLLVWAICVMCPTRQSTHTDGREGKQQQQKSALRENPFISFCLPCGIVEKGSENDGKMEKSKQGKKSLFDTNPRKTIFSDDEEWEFYAIVKNGPIFLFPSHLSTKQYNKYGKEYKKHFVFASW